MLAYGREKKKKIEELSATHNIVEIIGKLFLKNNQHNKGGKGLHSLLPTSDLFHNFWDCIEHTYSRWAGEKEVGS